MSSATSSRVKVSSLARDGSTILNCPSAIAAELHGGERVEEGGIKRREKAGGEMGFGMNASTRAAKSDRNELSTTV